MKLSFSRKLIVLYCQNLAGTYKRYSWTNPCLGERHEVSVGFSHVHTDEVKAEVAGGLPKPVGPAGEKAQ